MSTSTANSKLALTGQEGMATDHNPQTHPALELNRKMGAFSRISTQLNQAYEELESHVADLEQALNQSNAAHESEFFAKNLLAQRLELILDAMPVAVIMLDGHGSVVQANSGAKNLLMPSIIGRRWIDVIDECFAIQAEDGYEMQLKSGRLVSVVTQSLSNEPGQVIVVSDQTETRQLQAKLNHNRKLSEMGKMTASLAHQLRTPLSTAKLYVDQLAKPQLSAERRMGYAEKLRNRLLNLEQQVRDMLVFSKSGIALGDLITTDELLALIASRGEELSRVHGFRFSCPVNGGSGSIRCNQELLVGVFCNLIDNGFQACANQQEQASIEIHVQITNQSFVSVKIRDNGSGISQEVEEKILEPFFTTKPSGTGLGLSVVNAVVQAHGGCFLLKNNETQGASAEILLPLYSELN